MCGRYVLKASNLELQQVFGLATLPAWHARYNIAPLQAAPMITREGLVLAQWGLLPSWARSPKLAHQLINARAETVSQKPAFKDLLATHRCLVPCDGFYEWRHEGPRRLPHFIADPRGHLLAMAGLWSAWRSPEGMVTDTFTIITTTAQAALATLHDRMPVFLDEPGRALWLSKSTDVAALLRPWPEPLTVTEVSQHVNSVSVDDERCLAPPATTQLRLL